MKVLSSSLTSYLCSKSLVSLQTRALSSGWILAAIRGWTMEQVHTELLEEGDSSGGCSKSNKQEPLWFPVNWLSACCPGFISRMWSRMLLFFLQLPKSWIVTVLCQSEDVPCSSSQTHACMSAFTPERNKVYFCLSVCEDTFYDTLLIMFWILKHETNQHLLPFSRLFTPHRNLWRWEWFSGSCAEVQRSGRQDLRLYWSS